MENTITIIECDGCGKSVPETELGGEDNYCRECQKCDECDEVICECDVETEEEGCTCSSLGPYGGTSGNLCHYCQDQEQSERDDDRFERERLGE